MLNIIRYVLLSSGQLQRSTRDEVGYNEQKLTAPSSGGCKSESRVSACLGEGPLPGHRLFVLSSRGGSLCYKALIPFMRVPPSEAETTFPS